MDIVQTIIQGGAVGLALVSLWITWKLAGNHIHHNTEALKGLSENTAVNTEVLHGLSGVIGSLKDNIERKK